MNGCRSLHGKVRLDEPRSESKPNLVLRSPRVAVLFLFKAHSYNIAMWQCASKMTPKWQSGWKRSRVTSTGTLAIERRTESTELNPKTSKASFGDPLFLSDGSQNQPMRNRDGFCWEWLKMEES